MRTLSPIAPETVFRNIVRLPRDYYVRVFTNDYSIDPSMIGRLVDVTADPDTVTVSHDGLVMPKRTVQRTQPQGTRTTWLSIRATPRECVIQVDICHPGR